MTAVLMLENAGFAVVEAASADDTRTILETDPTISALFTDIEMPGSMNGVELASRVAARWPHIRLVVTYGRVRLRNQETPDDGQFLAKPYYPDELLSAFAHA